MSSCNVSLETNRRRVRTTGVRTTSTCYTRAHTHAREMSTCVIREERKNQTGENVLKRSNMGMQISRTTRTIYVVYLYRSGSYLMSFFLGGGTVFCEYKCAFRCRRRRDLLFWVCVFVFVSRSIMLGPHVYPGYTR